MKRIRVSPATLLTLVLLGLAAGASPAQGQVVALGAAATSVARAWGRGDADGVAQLLSRSGVALHLLDESHAAAGVRQARAALDQLFERQGATRVTKAEELGGTPERGFAEIAWDVTVPGSAEGLRHTVFVGFVREDGGWRIAEIRVLRSPSPFP